jgi:hypothetical protein
MDHKRKKERDNILGHTRADAVGKRANSTSAHLPEERTKSESGETKRRENARSAQKRPYALFKGVLQSRGGFDPLKFPRKGARGLWPLEAPSWPRRNALCAKNWLSEKPLEQNHRMLRFAVLTLCVAQAVSADQKDYKSMESEPGRCVHLVGDSDVMAMVEDTRIGVVLFAEENSDSLKMVCEGISWNVSNTDVALAYTLSPDLAQAFNQSSSEMSAALILHSSGAHLIVWWYVSEFKPRPEACCGPLYIYWCCRHWVAVIYISNGQLRPVMSAERRWSFTSFNLKKGTSAQCPAFQLLLLRWVLPPSRSL